MYGIVTKGRAANKNGTIWRTALDEKISDLGVHTAQVEATLVDAGFTAEDIHLPSLMNEIYLTELKYPQLQSVRRILIPLSSAASMAAYGDYLLAGVVAGIGLASIPIGKAFYRESNVYRAAKVRVAQAAKHAPFLEKLDKNMSI